MVYKGINGLAPEYISSMLTYVSEQHERSPGQQLFIYCIFQDLTHHSLTGLFYLKVRTNVSAIRTLPNSPYRSVILVDFFTPRMCHVINPIQFV